MRDGEQGDGVIPNVPGMAVTPSGDPPKVRKLYQVGGISGGDDLIVYNNSIVNLARGIAERVLFLRTENGYEPTPKPVDGVVNQRLGPFRRKLLNYLSSTTQVSGELFPCDVEDFPNLYTGRKKTVYQHAVASLRTRAVDIRDALLTAFVKAEKMLRKVARIIQPRGARYNVGVGVYLKPHEGTFYRAINDVWGEKVVAKGLNASEVGKLICHKWNKFHRTVAVMVDAKRFDQHFSVDTLRYEHSIYNPVFQSEELAEYLSWQINNQGVGYCPDGKLKYRVEGCRMSGDMNTSLGNTLLMCAMAYSYKEHKNIPCSFVNNGDDCVFFMEERYVDRFTQGFNEYFLELGFQMQVEEPVRELEHVDFCQCRPIFDGSSYTMVRNLHRALSKDSLSLVDISTRGGFEKWLWAVGCCGLSLTGGIPVVQEMYSAYLRGGKPGKVDDHPIFDSGFARMSRGMERGYAEITPRTRVSFWTAFGVTPDEQIQAERYFASLALTWNPPLPLTYASHISENFGLPQSILSRF